MGLFQGRQQHTTKSGGCAEWLSRSEELRRQEIYNTLEHERLLRKYGDIMTLYNDHAKSSWNELLYILFMRTLGDELNRDAFTELACRLPLSMLMRERSSITCVEAMLIGMSGFMESYPNEEYISPLREEAKYLLRKHDITPLSFRQWNLKRVRPFNHPIIRLSQVASIICSHEFIFNDMLQCTTPDDVERLFRTESTPHLLSTHPHLTQRGAKSLVIGSTKCMLIGINLVVPVQYAYGRYIEDDEICMRAYNLNENLPAESNRYIDKWRMAGLNPQSAFETQALIQLTKCYCKASKCDVCPVGKRIAMESSQHR